MCHDNPTAPGIENPRQEKTNVFQTQSHNEASAFEAQLAARAAAAEIQRELRDIETEFSITEMDGLE